jgi:hypothetical protein
MPAEPAALPVVAFDEDAFRQTFRAFHAQFAAALDAGIDLGALLSLLEEEGVELPDFVRMML